MLSGKATVIQLPARLIALSSRTSVLLHVLMCVCMCEFQINIINKYGSPPSYFTQTLASFLTILPVYSLRLSSPFTVQ